MPQAAFNLCSDEGEPATSTQRASKQSQYECMMKHAAWSKEKCFKVSGHDGETCPSVPLCTRCTLRSPLTPIK